MKKKKAVTIILVVVAVIEILAGFYLVLFYGVSSFVDEMGPGPFKPFAEYSSEDGRNRISISAKEPIWPFGSQTFQIHLNGYAQIFIVELANDGGRAQEGKEVQVEFTDNAHAVISFDGDEQTPEIFEIFFDTPNNKIITTRTKETPLVTKSNI